MINPALLMGLSAGLSGLQQGAEKQKQQQMVQALLAQRAQQNPGGMGAMGPQNWGAQNTSHGDTIYDQWGNPIGPAGAGSAALPPTSVASATPASANVPNIWSQGTDPTTAAPGAAPSLPYQPPGMSPTAPIPGLGGPSQATPPQGVGGYQAPMSSMDEAMANALFSPTFAAGF